MSRDIKAEMLHQWRENLDAWYQERLADWEELKAFREFGARQMQNQLGWEPNKPIGQKVYVTRPIPHGDPVYRRVDPEVSPLMQECLDYAEEKAREHRAKKAEIFNHGALAPDGTWRWYDNRTGKEIQVAGAVQGAGQQASADNASERVRKYIQGKVYKYAVGVDMATSPEEKGESSFDFVERKVKVICPRCGDRPWPTAKPFDETDLNCPACGSRELERIG